MIITLIRNNKVVGTPVEMSEEEIEAALPSYQQAVDVTNENPTPGVGWGFNGRSFDPPVGVTGKKSMIITKLAYRQRFTTGEMVAIYVAKDTNPVLRLLIDNLSVASFIDLERADTYTGTMYLYSQGLLTLARAQEILTTTPTAIEIYKG